MARRGESKNQASKLLGRVRRLLRDCTSSLGDSPLPPSPGHLVLTGSPESWRVDAHLSGESELCIQTILSAARGQTVSALSAGLRPVLTIGGCFFGEPVVLVIHLHPGGQPAPAPSLN